MLAGNKIAVSTAPLLKSVSVKALAEFAAKSGSLDRKFTPGPTALEGIEGHQRVTARRSEHYQSEISLSIHYRNLLIRGRADGYQTDTNCIEEIKTFYGDVEKIPTNHRLLHWAQVKLYGWMLCELEGHKEVRLALVYFHLGDGKEHRLEQQFSAEELKDYCETFAEKYYLWQRRINTRLTHLTEWIDDLPFPYTELHPSQRQMAEAVYKAAATGRVLLAEAPTGTGKTLAGLFPAIKALHKTPVNKIFYLTAKTTGKQLALENLQLIATDSTTTPLRVLELTAQEKSCLEPDKRCSGDSCIFALDFYDKLADARQAAYDIPMLTKTTLATIARQYQICPFYLSVEMSRWADVIVADYNYYFDGSALLLGLTKEFNWHPYLLVDESHNLLDRGRSMYSASLNRGLLLAAKQHAPHTIKKSLTRINKLWLAILKELKPVVDKLTILENIPDTFMLSLIEFANHYIELLQKQPDHPVQHTIMQEFFFEILNFQSIAELVDDDFCIDMQNLNTKSEVLTLRNIIPAKLLGERLAVAHSACFFSATLRPAYFYQTLLGLPDNTIHIDVASPFAATQLNVNIAHNLSTRYRDRATSIEPICTIVKQQLLAESGNALIFFSSYEFLQQVQQQLISSLKELDIRIIVQSKKMSEEDRHVFIQQFTLHKNILGLAVLGGAFSEGIDLPGDALKGAFIATLGLPQINDVNEYMKLRLQKKFQQGYNFTYLYPGIQKVVQAAGRVIRKTSDKGYVWLLDDRFSQPEIANLLPQWWK